MASVERTGGFGARLPVQKSLKERIRWQVDLVRHERKFMTLVARLDQDNRTFLDFYISPKIDRLRRFRVALKDEWLSRNKRLHKLSEFCAVVSQVRQLRR